MTSTVQRAYGLQLHGLPRVPELAAGSGSPDASVVSVRISTDARAAPPLAALDADGSVRRLADGRVLALDRRRSTATFHGPPLDAGSLAHPYLAPVATTFNRWAGREAFHAGAFVADGRAWAVLGPRTAGKSSLLAGLASRRVPVLSDDVLVTDGRAAFAGPRCLDLRQPLPSVPDALSRARSDSRWRMFLPGVGDRVALGGWIYLRWGPEMSMRPLEVTDLLRRLARGRAGQVLESDPSVLLALASVPSWDLQRPKDWHSLEATLDLVCSTVGDARPSAPAGRRVPATTPQ